jgi:16S rRNA processing protein RimM
MTDPDRLILLGEIGAAHGIRGEVAVRTFTADPADIAAYGALSDKTGTRSFTITGLRVTAKAVVARFAGVNDRTAAEKLRNTGLYVRRSRLPAPEPGAYYHEDLVGLDAVGLDGTSLGRVAAVVNYGAGDLIEIARPGETDTLLVPFTDAAVPSVDLAARRMVVVPPAYGADDDEPQETE